MVQARHFSTTLGHPSRKLGRFARYLSSAAVLFAAAGLLLSPGCSSECSGVMVEGVCEELCDNAACAQNHVCVANDCRPFCSDQGDCPLRYNCVPVAGADGKPLGNVCFQLDYAKNGSTGQNSPCTSDAECDALRGFSCADGRCVRSCATHDDCGPLGLCAGEGAERSCTQTDGEFGPGQFNTRCPDGDECDASAGFECVGIGAGDADAYCTKVNCAESSDCAPGYACIDQRGDHGPCAPACGFAGFPNDEDCVPVEEIDQPGSEWRCGSVSLLRKACIKQDYCTPCETDADCGALPGQICAKDATGTKICTTLCDERLPGACPFGSASSCRVYDEELGLPTCGHKFERCLGDGNACEPCVVDADCGPNGYCYETPSSRERLCIDLDFTCTADSECPESPGGVIMDCLLSSSEVSPTSPLYQKCFAPNVATSLTITRHGCWRL